MQHLIPPFLSCLFRRRWPRAGRPAGTFALFLLAAGTLSAQPAAPVTLTFTRTQLTLREVLERIEQDADLTVAYNDETKPETQRVTMPGKELELEEVIREIEKQTPVRVRRQNGNLYLRAVARESITVQGQVLSADRNEALPGVSIVTGDGKGVGITDAEGRFSLSLESGTAVTFSFIGYQPTVLTLSAPARDLVVRLQPDTKQLGEVVVTALGIKREERALGYAVKQLDGQEFTDARPNNWTQALTGKVAGLNVLKAGSGPAGSSRIVLRGETSLDMDENQALIVVDGVPVNDRLTGTGSGAYLQSESPVDFGNGFADLNPDDIESVSVLKGASAAALYGSRAANGAIIITTKAGRKRNQGLGITFNSNTAFDNILRWPDFQYEYGQGVPGGNAYYSYGTTEDGKPTHNTSAAWGPKFEGQSYFQYHSPMDENGVRTERMPWVPYENNRRDFFRTGITFTNSIAVDGGNDRTTARLSLTNLRNTWILPNTGYDRTNVALAVNQKLSDKLEISSRINYTRKSSDNLPNVGYNNQSIMYFMLFQTPNVNLDWYRSYWLPGQEGLVQNTPFSGLIDNPYLQMYQMLNQTSKNSLIGTLSATYHFAPNLSLMLRTGLDYGYEERTQQRPRDTEKFKEGMFRMQNVYNYEMNSDFLLRYEKNVSRWGTVVSLGGNHRDDVYSSTGSNADRLVIPGVYNLTNSKNLPIVNAFRSRKVVNSLYGLMQVSYDEKVYVDLTARNDWSSTLPVGNNSYFYPSVSTSLMLHELLPLPSVVSFAKLRASWAQVGNDSRPYQLARYYNSHVVSGSFVNPTAIPNGDLKPEITTSVELGADVRLLGNRLGLDVTVYNNNSRNQILPVPIDRASGYQTAILNAGLINNRGVEVQLTGTPFKTAGGFTWKITGNWAKNQSKVVELTEGVDTYIVARGVRGTLEARPGGKLGDIYGLGYLRSPDGQIVHNKDGYPLLGEEVKLLGNSTPQWRAGIENEFAYKQFRLGFLFDGQYGGHAYSLTHNTMMEQGKSKKTLPGRYEGIIGEGVIQNADGSYRPNDVMAKQVGTYYVERYKRDNVEANLFETTYLKLREARLDYTLPAGLAARLRMQKATIGVFGRDLLLFTDWPAWDPEIATLNNGSITPGFETAQFPSTRTYGVNLSVSF